MAIRQLRRCESTYKLSFINFTAMRSRVRSICLNCCHVVGIFSKLFKRIVSRRLRTSYAVYCFSIED